MNTLKAPLPELVQLGRNLRVARQRRGMTMEDLAQRAGLTRQTLGMLETGTSPAGLDTLLSVLNVLGMSRSLSQVADPQADQLGQTLEFERSRRERVRAPAADAERLRF